MEQEIKQKIFQALLEANLCFKVEEPLNIAKLMTSLVNSINDFEFCSQLTRAGIEISAGYVFIHLQPRVVILEKPPEQKNVEIGDLLLIMIFKDKSLRRPSHTALLYQAKKVGTKDKNKTKSIYTSVGQCW